MLLLFLDLSNFITKGTYKMTVNEKALKLHEEWQGKIETVSKCRIKTREDLALAYTPGVAEPCKVIADNKEAVYTYTSKANTVAVVSDGSAVLGLGNIGAYAAMPVMEGKAALFKEFGNVNAVPICLDTQDPEEIIETVIRIAPAFGGINLEDISAPRCFEIEARLKEALDIPVFHDDQHGTAIVVLAAAMNGLRLTGKKKEDCKVVVNGAGSAGIAITRLLLNYGFKHVTMCDRFGIISKNYPNLNWMQEEMTKYTNLEGKEGTLADALKGADIFVGVSAPGIVTAEMVASMNKDSLLFAMANPVPEIMPDIARAAGARVVATGRSDFPNQINNVTAFPGIFRGALEGRARQITEEMKLAAASALAGLVSDEELSEDFIMPDPFDPRIVDVVAAAVKDHIID
jgi:malate dehydrogenase (oxaloacetate-decarboxylating)